jgi:hypothetical protein
LSVAGLRAKWHQLGGFLERVYIKTGKSGEFRVLSEKPIKDKRLEKSYTVMTPSFPLTATGA